MLNPTGLKVASPGVKAKPGLEGKVRGNSAKSILDYAADVCAGDYYGARGEAESLATGAGWADLGFAPNQQPNKQQLENLLNGMGPHGNQLARIRATEKTHEIRSGVDLTFSAPKSFSIACAFAGRVHKAELRAAQVAAIQDAISWIEDEGYVTLRSGRNGKEREPATRLIVNTWYHETSRAEDPQEHAHAVLFNLAQTESGEWRRIDPADIYRNKIEIGAVYRASLAKTLVSLGYSVERDGTSFKIAGIPPEVCQRFSKGADAIREKLLEWGTAGGKAKQDAAYQVRNEKRHTSKAKLESRWRTELADLGFSIDDLAAIRTEAQKAQGVAYDERAVVHDLSANNATFIDRDLRKAVAIAMQAGGGGPEDIRHAINRLRRSGKLVELIDPEGVTRWTTTEMRRDELEMVRLWARRQGSGRPVSDATLMAAIAAAEKIKGLTFSTEQRKAVQAITQGKSADKFLQGVAGAGKSTLALAVRLAYEMEGRKVHGVAFSAKAAAGLGDGTGIDTSTIDSFLLTIERKPSPPGSVVLIDEASMSHTRQFLAMMKAADRYGFELGIIGDTVQLQAIQAGSAFAFLYERALQADVAEIKTASRQVGVYAEEWKKKLDEVRGGRCLPALAYLDELGGLKVSEEGEHVQDAVRAWLSNREAGLSLEENVIVTNKKDMRRQLNEAVRQAIGIAESTENVTVATTDREGQSTNVRNFAPGDRVITLRNSKLGKINLFGTDDNGRVSNGSVWTIEDIQQASEAGALITMRSDTGRRVRFATFEYDALDHAYCYTVHQAQGISAQGAICLISDANMVDRHSVYVMLSRSRLAERTHLVIPNSVLDEAEIVAGSEDAPQDQSLAERLDTVVRAAEKMRIDHLSITYRAKDTELQAREAQEMAALATRGVQAETQGPAADEPEIQAVRQAGRQDKKRQDVLQKQIQDHGEQAASPTEAVIVKVTAPVQEARQAEDHAQAMAPAVLQVRRVNPM